ncbi:MAG: V-type ATP synthase subunit E family protein [Ruminococcus flavefaciens]|nr:V-type ATP synthase subunit E family protein [Ruminococcus flavefaciens]
MSGIDGILNIIESQQKMTENNIIRTAEEKARAIEYDGESKAEKAYSDYMKKAMAKAETDYRNACNSTDAENRRKILQCRVEIIDTAVEKILERLSGLPDSEYFDMILRLAGKKLHNGDGKVFFGKKDLARLPADFPERLSALAVGAGGKVEISATPADIDDGFILEYGLISENCTFKAILESEKDTVRDILAKELFGR